MKAQEMMNIDKADLVWRILTLESKVEAQNILIKALEDSKSKFDPDTIAVGSAWKCVIKCEEEVGRYRENIFRDCSVGYVYRVIEDDSHIVFIDDVGEKVGFDVEHAEDCFLKHFKRVL